MNIGIEALTKYMMKTGEESEEYARHQATSPRFRLLVDSINETVDEAQESDQITGTLSVQSAIDYLENEVDDSIQSLVKLLKRRLGPGGEDSD